MKKALVFFIALFLTSCVMYEERVEIEVMVPPIVDLSKYKKFDFIVFDDNFNNMTSERVDVKYEISNFILNELRTKGNFEVELVEDANFIPEKIGDPLYWQRRNKPTFVLIYSGEISKYYAFYRRELTTAAETPYMRQGLVETRRLKLNFCFYVMAPDKAEPVYKKCFAEKTTASTYDPVAFSLYTVLQRSFSIVLRDISYQRVRQTHFLLRYP